MKQKTTKLILIAFALAIMPFTISLSCQDELGAQLNYYISPKLRLTLIHRFYYDKSTDSNDSGELKTEGIRQFTSFTLKYSIFWFTNCKIFLVVL